MYGAGNTDGCELVHAPFALTPVPFPRDAFQRAKDASIPFNAMIDAVSQDGEYLEAVLEKAAKYDSNFTVRKIHCCISCLSLCCKAFLQHKVFSEDAIRRDIPRSIYNISCVVS